METTLVSILTPFKNTAQYLEECLVSIQAQSYPHWELCIVDDNSTDNSFAIVERFARKDNRIKLLKNPSSGIIPALQHAFENAQGNLITRMDSDDIMTPNKLDVLVGNLCQHGQGYVAVGLVKYISETTVGPGYKSYENWLNNLTKTGENYTEIYKECVIPSPCWMIHRSDLIACGAFNPQIYPEDYDLTFRFYKHGYTCIPCSALLHYWRDYSTRTSRTHVHYAQNHFTSLKTTYFINLDYNPSKTLVLWGAGKKGKIAAQILVSKQIAFEWICDNPNKIGHTIYGTQLRPFESLKTIPNPQSIITVANKNAQAEIRNYMNNLGLKPIEDYVFFC